MKSRRAVLPLIAEDLGIITSDVADLIDKFYLLGMRVLAFAFTHDPANSPHAPHNLERNCVMYTGTSDYAITLGRLETDATQEEKQRLFSYIGRELTPEQLPAELIRLTIISVADTVIIRLQDIISLAGISRMNRPGTDECNWR